MEMIELQTNDSLKNVFEPSDLRTLYSGLLSEVLSRTGKFTVAMMTVFAVRLMSKRYLF
jgi:hypothetical protein